MAEKKALKDEVKKVLNSVLCSYQKGATLKQLTGDYEMLEGKPLPFRKMGYTNIEDFLRSISDAVYITYERGELIVKAVANEQNMRILDLVSKQRSSKKSTGRLGCKYIPRYGRSSNRGRGGQRRFYQRERFPPRHYRPFPQPQDNYAFSEDDDVVEDDLILESEAPPAPTIPIHLRGKIRELFFAYKDGLSAGNFLLAFKRRFGAELRCSDLGFNSLYDFLLAMPDIVRVDMYPGGAFRVYGKHIKQTESESATSTTSSDIGHNFKVNDKWKSLIQMVFDRYPDGIWATKMASEFKVITGKELPYKALGFLSVIEMMSSLPEIVTIERPNSKDWLLFDARVKPGYHSSQPQVCIQKSEEPKPVDPSLSTAPSLGQEFKETLRQVLLAHSNGLSLGELPAEFERLAGYDIPLKSLGYASIDVLVTSVHTQDILTMKYVGDGNVLVFGTESDRKVPNYLRGEHCPVKPRREIPPDAIGPGNFYRTVPVPDQCDYMVVYVSNVESPSSIWIHLKGEGTTEALDDMMDDLDVFYNGDQGKSYIMPESLIKVGQICVALFPEDQNWHRVTITGTRNIDFVEVYYVDYGSSSCVTKSSLRMLRSKFLKLPAQAIRARLSNIQPLNRKEWSPAAKKRLLDLVLSRPLVAMPTHYDEMNEVLSLCLCDTSGEEDLHINDILFKENFAVMVPDDYSTLTSAHQPVANLLGIPEGKAAESHQKEPHQPLKLHLPNDGSLEKMKQNQDSSKTKLSNVSQQKFEEENQEVEEYVRNIKYVDLTDEYSMHIIKYEDKPYCSSGDISAMLWQRDFLWSKLKHKGIAFPNVELLKEEHSDIFEEFLEYKVKGTIENNELKSRVTVYEMKYLIKILELFDHHSEGLKAAIQEQIDRFNPDDQYWRGEESEEDDDTVDIGLGLDDLETAQDHLHLQRKKILQMLRTDPDNVTKYVDDLDQVERKLVEVRANIKRLQDNPNEDPENTVSAANEADMLVQMCFDEQYKNTQTNNKPPKKLDLSPKKELVTEQKINNVSPPKKTNMVAPMPVSPKPPKSNADGNTNPQNDLSSAFSNMSFNNQVFPTFNQLPAQELPSSHQQLLNQYQMMLSGQCQNPALVGSNQSYFANPLTVNSGVNPVIAATAAQISQQMVSGGNYPVPNMFGSGLTGGVSVPGAMPELPTYFSGSAGPANITPQPGVSCHPGQMPPPHFQNPMGSNFSNPVTGQGQVAGMQGLRSLFGCTASDLHMGSVGRGYNQHGTNN